MKSFLRTLPRCAFTITAIALVVTSIPAGAQTPPPAGDARAHFDRGVEFYNETDYSAALVEFDRAYTLAPTWQVLFNIGQSYFQIRRYAEALVTLRRFVDEGQGRIPDDRRALVEGELSDLANRVGHANIRSNVAGATISVDDLVVGVTPLSDPVLVSVGVRKIEATTAANAPIEQEVSVPAGETVEVHLEFPEAPPPPTSSPPAEPLRSIPPSPSTAVLRAAAPPAARPRSRGAALASFGVAVAGAAVGGVFGTLVLRDRARLEGECAGKACLPGSQSDIDAVARDGTISTIGFGVAAAGLVAGVVFWIAGGAPSTASAALASPGPLGVARAGAQPGPSLQWSPGFVSGSF